MGLPAKQLVLDRAGGGLVSCNALAAGRGSCHLKGNALCIGFQTCDPDEKALSILLVKPISSMPSLLKTKALTSNQTKALTRLIYITKRILVKQPFAFIEEI